MDTLDGSNSIKGTLGKWMALVSEMSNSVLAALD